MNGKRHRSVVLAIGSVILGTSSALTGCKSPLGGLAFWNARSNQNTAVASATPDVGKQKYDGLAQEFDMPATRPMGQVAQGKTPMGGQKPAAKDGMLLTAWKKTTGSVSDTFSGKPQTEAANDATRLDSPSKKVGPEVYISAAQLLEGQAKFSEAQQQYERALKSAPNNLNALIGLARLHDRQGQNGKALATYQVALQAHPNNALVHNDLGLCFARQRQLDKSIESLTKAVALQPQNAKYHNNLATVLVEAGRNDEAISHLAAHSSQAVAHYNVGFLLHKKGENTAAAAHFQQAIALDPGLAPARQMLAQLGAFPPADGTNDAPPQIASRQAFDVGGPYRTASSSQSRSTATPTGGQYNASSYHIGDDGVAGGGSYRPEGEGASNTDDQGTSRARASLSDLPSARLPPVE